MAKVTLEFGVNGLENSIGSFKELKDTLKEVKSQLAVATDPEQIRQLESAAGELNDRMQDLGENIAANTGEPLERLGGNLGLLKGKLFALDFKGVNKGLQGMTGAVKGLNFKGLTDGIGGAVKSLGQLGKALLANPIFLIAVVIIGIIAAFDKLKSAGGVVGKVFSAIGDAIGWVIQQVKDFLDWIGLTDFATQEQAEKTIEAKQKEVDAIEERYNTEIALAQAAGENTFELEKEKLQQLQDNAQAQIDAYHTLEESQGELTDDQKSKLEEQEKNYQKYVDQTLILEAKRNAEIKKSNEDLEKQTRDINTRLIANATERSKQEAANKRDDALKALETSQGDEQKIADAKKAINEEYNKSVNDINNKAAKESADRRLKALQTQNQIDILTTKEGTEARVKAEEDASKKLVEFYQKNYRALGMTEKEMTLTVTQEQARIADIRKKFNDKIVADVKARNEEIRKQQEQERKDEEELIKKLKGLRDELTLTERDKALKAIQDQQNQRLAILEQGYQQGLINEQTYQDGVTQINANADAQRTELAKKEKEERLKQSLEEANKKIETAAYFNSALGSLNSAFNEIQQNGLKEGEKLSVQQQKRQFQREKGLNIISALINGAQAVTKAIAQFGPPPSPLGIAGIATAGIITAAQVAAIASKQFNPESPSSGGGTGNNVSITAPATLNPNTLFSTGQGGTGTVGQQQSNQVNGGSPVRAYVVSQEITTAQQRQNQIQNIASL